MKGAVQGGRDAWRCLGVHKGCYADKRQLRAGQHESGRVWGVCKKCHGGWEGYVWGAVQIKEGVRGA